MRRWLLCFAMLVVMAGPGCARRSRAAFQPNGAPPNGGPQVAGQQGWAWPEITPPGLGVAFRMPAQPRYEQRFGREEDGAFYRSISARAEVPYGAFGMIVTEWEGGLVGDTLEAAHEVANNVFSEQQLTQRRTQRLDIGGFYGREDTGLAPNGVFVALRQFVGARRIYVAFAIVAHAPGPLATAESFMGSIRLDVDDALLPVGGTSTALSAIFVPETDFAVRMPPISSRRTEDLRVGDHNVVTHSFVSETAGARLRVRVIDLPERADPETVEEVTRALALGQTGAPVSASGFPGNVFTRTTGSVSIEGRMFITAQRIYVIEAARPGSGQASDTVRDFFDSFRIL